MAGLARCYRWAVITAGNNQGAALAAQPTWGSRLAGIEGLRGIAALCVLVHHVSIRTQHAEAVGPYGVVAGQLQHGLTLFFVLSGFLLFRPFAMAVLDGRALPSLRRYATNRFLRIYPVYVVILLISGVVFDAAYRYGSPRTSPADNVGRITDLGTLAADLFLVQTYIPGKISTGIGPAWSLTAEIAFYVVMPVLAIGAAIVAKRLPRLVAVLLPPALLILVGLSTTLWLRRLASEIGGGSHFAWGQNWTSVVSRSLLAQADLFAYGMLAAIVVCLIQQRRRSTVQWWVPVSVLGAAAAITAFAMTADATPTSSWMGVASALLLLAVALPPSRAGRSANALALLLEFAPLRYLGLISYSVYLWHNPVLWWLKTKGLMFGGDLGSVLLNVALVTAITVVLSTATYFLVERPALRLKLKVGHTRERGRVSAGPAHTGRT